MEPPEHNAAPSRWSGLSVRLLSGMAAAAVFLGALWLGGWAFMALTLFAALLMLREWDALTAQDSASWKAAGLLYIALPCASLIWLRQLRFAEYHDAGLLLVLYVMAVVWATDIGAYFTGKRIGGPKLAPAISPGKTWAGLAGGLLAAAIIGALCHAFAPYPFTVAHCALLGLLLALIAQAGDLFESWLKRRAGVKDSGTLLPGHGGLLDRVDGLIFTVPFYALLVAFSF